MTNLWSTGMMVRITSLPDSQRDSPVSLSLIRYRPGPQALPATSPTPPVRPESDFPWQSRLLSVLAVKPACLLAQKDNINR